MIHLLLSILAGVAGSALGSAARVGIDAADRRLNGEPLPENVVINASPTAGAVAGVLGIFLGVRRAFWVGAVLSAAGAERLDRRVLGRAGIDLDGLVARAQEAAAQARGRIDEAIPVGVTEGEQQPEG
ncbi:MAG TPA: hypothetical protein VFH63_02360 [candidate division Zixibacteria bacterium]|nr:hypothetical protein [candidate division Zixibacteria bacterium]